MRRALAPVAALTMLALVVGLIVLAVRSSQQAGLDQRQTNHQICRAINNLNAVISQTLRRSRKNLDTLSYYKQHPLEKAQQEKEIARTLRLFTPHPCP